MDRITADYIGMLVTVMNALSRQQSLKRSGTSTRTQSSIAIPSVVEPYVRARALKHLDKGRVVIFAAGSGNPCLRLIRQQPIEPLRSEQT
jgi:uridylate kinase